LERPDLDYLRHLERMDETNLVKRIREERVTGYKKKGRSKKSWNELVGDRGYEEERLVHQ